MRENGGISGLKELLSSPAQAHLRKSLRNNMYRCKLPSSVSYDWPVEKPVRGSREADAGF
jgi:hypothetical protein